MSTEPALPIELILTIIECLSPRSPIPIALPPTHLTTKTFLTLALTSSITYPIARRLLYTHCLYIDNTQRLLRLNASLHLETIAHLSPRTRPHVPIIPHMNSLYLSYPTIELHALATNVMDLFTALAPYLRRLVVDIPFRDFDIADIFETQALLRDAFSKLTALETFCNVRDELFLDLIHPRNHIRERWEWTTWPNLKTLALYNKDVSTDGFWAELGRLEGLETLVFTRADGLDEVDMKVEWKKHCKDERRGLEIVLVNVQSGHREVAGRERWKDKDKIRITEVNVPTSYYGDDDPICLCQDWVKRRMLRGEPPTEWN